MKIRQVVFPLLFGLLFFAGCENNHLEQRTFEVSTQPMTMSDSNRLLLSSKCYFNDQKQSEVSLKLKTIVNGGEYKITSVKTSYSRGFLIAAEVTYDIFGRGDGIRVSLIQSNRYYKHEKASDVKSQLDAMVNDVDVDVIRVQTIYRGGYLRAAEIYYYQKK